MTRNLAGATRAALVAVIASTAIITAAPIGSAVGCYTGTAEGDYCYTSTATESTVVGYIGTSVDVAIPGTLGGLPVTAIGTQAFYLKYLETVTIPDSVTTIGEDAFRQNSISSLALPSSLVSVDAGAFNHNALTSLTLPDGVEVIGSHAFSYNDLTSLTIPSSVTTIRSFAFYRTSLDSVAFASTTGLATIEDSAFGSNFLKTVTMGGDEPASLGTSAFGAVASGNDPLVSFPEGATYTHGVPGVWSANGTDYRVQEPVTVIFVTPVGTAPATAHPIAYTGTVDPGDLTATGYRFDGWYAAASGGTALTFPRTMTGDTTFYAQWEARAVTSPSNAGTKESVTVSGTGFEPGESVRIELHSDPVLLTTVIADAGGAFTTTVTIPSTTAAGNHSLVLLGSLTGASTHTLTISAALADTGTNPTPLALTALGLVGVGLLLRRLTAR